MSVLRRAVSRARKKFLGIRPPDANPYATHLPVLIALARVRPITRVLELGSGEFSTRLFLDRAAFPDLSRLDSFEDDAEWASTVAKAVGTDTRLNLTTVATVNAAVPDADVDAYELVFIDDSQEVTERSKTIENVARQRPRRAIVAIHDYENRAYRRASRRFEHRYVFKSLTPQVGVCWNGTHLSKQQLAELEQRVDAMRDHVLPTDAARWVEALSSVGSARS